jgi:AraC-like DNA-binding protein/mannose-6-phosphate isomerase-like protein (cupin superfamily)
VNRPTLPSLPPGRSTNRDDYQSVPRVVTVMAKNYRGGFWVTPHRHRRAQLLYAVSGVMQVTTAVGSWVVPPNRAVWVPANVGHDVRMSGDVAIRTLYVDTTRPAGLPKACTVVEVSPLLRELILALLEEPVQYDLKGRGALIANLILRELRTMEVAPLHLPIPEDPRLARLCDSIMARPDMGATLETLSASAGASVRTIARLFRRETGLSFRRWREQARLIQALKLLGEGRSVGRVAEKVGYRSASAFSAMFRRALGREPRQYFA